MKEKAESDKSFLISEKANSFYLPRGNIGCILIHGFVGTPWSLLEIGEFLAQHQITVSAPLLPGHGTQPDDLIGIPWSRWVERVRSEFYKIKKNCDCVFLLGHSMGGSIALLLASQLDCAGVISLSGLLKINKHGIGFIPVVKYFKKYEKRQKSSLRDPLPPEGGYDCYPLAAVYELNRMLKKVCCCLSSIECPVLIFHALGDKRVPVGESGKIMEGISSLRKSRILLDYPCHLITKGDDKERIHDAVLSFIRANSLDKKVFLEH